MTKIPWTQHTWNPYPGCTKVSPGCRHCYAEKMAVRLAAMGKRGYSGVVTGLSVASDGWNGLIVDRSKEAKAQLDKIKGPALVFVQSMGDLFHPAISDAQISRAMTLMYLRPDLTFQILTKRPERAAQYFEMLRAGKAVLGIALESLGMDGIVNRLVLGDGLKISTDGNPPYRIAPNIWFGVTAENQEWLDKRAPVALRIPASVQFVSLEPMLGPVDIGGHLCGLDWVIVGCESGPGRRPCARQWIRDVVIQCDAAAIQVFVKQMEINGRVDHDPDHIGEELDYPTGAIRQWPEYGHQR